MIPNPVLVHMGLLLFGTIAAFALGIFAIRRIRKSLTAEPDSLDHVPLAREGLPAHAYQAVIQQLKQQKHEMAAQQLSERRKAKVSDTLSSAVLANLSSGVVFLNTSGLVRQANAAARKLLGFASPVGLSVGELFHNAGLRPVNDGAANVAGAQSATAPESPASLGEALAGALAGKSAIRGLLLNYVTREGENRVLEVTASPVMAEDTTLMGVTLVINDKTDIERFRHDQRVRQEASTEMAQELRDSLATIAGYAQQLACSRDPELARQLASQIAGEAAKLDRTIGSFLAGAHAATAAS